MRLSTTSKSSNEQLTKRVWNSLQHLSCQRLSQVECLSRGTTIVLHGKTRSFYLKQLAQTIALKVPGVHHVVNEVQVIKSGQTQ